jgi:uncharacterized protein (DUF2141 family)
MIMTMPRMLIGLIFYACTVAQGATAQLYTLTVHVIGLKSDKGKLYMSVYKSAEGYPGDIKPAVKLGFSAISHGECTIVFDSIPKGSYAVACFHDENDNGKMDRNFFGIPVEGFGASNDARGMMGPPKFKDAQFALDQNVRQTIHMQY